MTMQNTPAGVASSDVAPLAHDVNSAAKILGISASKVWMMIRDGEIRPVRLGKRTLITTMEIQRLLTPAV